MCRKLDETHYTSRQTFVCNPPSTYGTSNYAPPRQQWVHNPLNNTNTHENGIIAQSLIKGGIISKRSVLGTDRYYYQSNHDRAAEFLTVSGGIRDVKTDEGQRAIRALTSSSHLRSVKCLQNAQGQINTMPVEIVVETILPYVRPKYIARFGRTCRHAQRIVQNYIGLNKNVTYRLANINIIESDFAAILARSTTWAAIIGDFALQTFLGERYPITDIILYCGGDVHVPIKSYFLQQGYKFKNKVRRKAQQVTQHANILTCGSVTVRLQRSNKPLNSYVSQGKSSHLMCFIAFANGAAEPVDCLYPDATRARRLMSSIPRGAFDRYAAYGFKKC